MRFAAPAAGVLLASVVTGCLQNTPTSPTLPTMAAAKACLSQAQVFDGEVVAAFNSTLGRIRVLGGPSVEPPRWSSIRNDQPAVLCYIDAAIAKAPPGQPPFDRILVAVVADQGELIAAGYRDELIVRAP